MNAEHEVHVHITVSNESYALTCTQCGEEILRASTGDIANRKKAADLGWKLAAMHLCNASKKEKGK